MRFALEKAQLERYLKGIMIALPLFEAMKDNSENQIEKIYAQQENIVEFENNAWKAIAKIGKMYTDMVQKKFLSVKTSSK